MKFINPYLLWLLILVPAVFFLFLYSANKRRKILLLFLNYESLKKISPVDLRRKRQISNFFILCSLFFLIIAISGPVTGLKKAETKREGVDIVFLLDASKSMLAEDIKPSRIKRAKLEIKELIKQLKGDRTGLVVFSGEPFLQSPLTLDNNGFNLLLKGVDPLDFPVGGTNLHRAINKGIDAFDSESDTSKVMIILTDGGENTGEDPIKAAEDADKKGIVIFTAGIGSSKGAPIPLAKGGFVKDGNNNIVISRVDKNILEKIADKTGGEYLGGDNRFDLVSIYEEKIRKKMSLTEFSAKENIEDINSYRIPLIISIILMIAGFILGSEKKGIISLFFALGFILYPGFSNSSSLKEDGRKLYEEKKYNKAFDAWTKEQINNPDSLKLYYNIGNSAYKNEDLETAEKNYEKVIESKGGEAEHLKYSSMFNLGNVNLLQKDYDRAINYYQDYLKKIPEDGDAKKNLELAKKLKNMEEQNKKNQDSKDNKDKDSKKDKSKDKKDGKSQENKDKKEGKKDNSSRKDNESSKKDDKNSDKKNEEKSSSKEKKSKENKDKKDSYSSASKGDEKDKGEKSPIKPDKTVSYDILNKVKDKPLGLIPYYKKREVEKDW